MRPEPSIDALQSGSKVVPRERREVGGCVQTEQRPRVCDVRGDNAAVLLGFEGEGEYEQGEIESARAFIEFANEAVKNAASAAGSGPNPQAVARTAVIAAAKRRAPNQLKGGGGASGGSCSCGSGKSSGRWYRRGRRIVLAGV